MWRVPRCGLPAGGRAARGRVLDILTGLWVVHGPGMSSQIPEVLEGYETVVGKAA